MGPPFPFPVPLDVVVIVVGLVPNLVRRFKLSSKVISPSSESSLSDVIKLEVWASAINKSAGQKYQTKPFKIKIHSKYWFLNGLTIQKLDILSRFML